MNNQKKSIPKGRSSLPLCLTMVPGLFPAMSLSNDIILEKENVL